MKKALFIGLKDLQVTFRDRAALIMMLLAPFLLTLGLGFVTGSFDQSENDQGIRDIGVVLVNEDEGTLGALVAETLTGNDQLQTLFAVQTATDAAAARQMVVDNSVSAAVIIPAGFSAGLVPDAAGNMAPAAPLEIQLNPSAPISADVVRLAVNQIVDNIALSIVTTDVAMTQLVSSGSIQPQQVPEIAAAIGQSIQQTPPTALVTWRDDSAADEEENSFDPLTLLAPGMALFFLMYTVTIGGRSILLEREEGTLPRMLSTPTSATQVLGGKVFGVFFIAVAQVSILIVASTLLFGLRWGDPLGIIVLIVATALAATGWGLLFASVATTAAQVAGIGSAVMLLFGLLSGVFIPVGSGVLNIASRITPNAWALDGFVELGYGESIGTITTNIAALLIMAVTLFAVSVFLFRRKEA
jgi:ABC-2 type transport system permease protein